MFGTKVVEKIKTHISCSVPFSFFFFENHAVYEIMWTNMVQADRPQMTWRMRIACWIPKATNTHLKYVILVIFPREHWLCERALFLLYTYAACLVNLGPLWWWVLTSRANCFAPGEGAPFSLRIGSCVGSRDCFDVLEKIKMLLLPGIGLR